MPFTTSFLRPWAPPSPRWTLLLAVLLGCIALEPARGQDPPITPARTIPEGLNYANGLFRDRRYELAAREYEHFLKDAQPGPDAADARFGLANARLFQGEYATARREFESFLKQAPEHANGGTAWYRVGETAYMLGDLPAARQAFETFTSKYPKHKYLETAGPYLGDVYLVLKDLDNAKGTYERSLQEYPEGRLIDRARFGLGRALLLQGKPDDALELFSTLIAKGGREWVDRASVQSGLAHAKAKRDDKAVEAFESLEKLAPKSPLIAEERLNRAEALARLGRRDEAEELLRGLMADAPQNLAAPSALALGTMQLQKDDAAAAIATLDDAAKRFPGSPMTAALLFRSAEAALKLGKGDDARARFLRAAESEPKDSWAEDALLRAARLALDQDDAQAASKLADTFATRFPKSAQRADARLVAARAALKADRAKEAIAILTASLADDKPEPATAQAETYYLGLAYGKDGQSAKASAVLDSLAKTSAAPVAADAQFLVGQGHIEAGKFAEAAAALESYLNGKPDGDVADYALAHLVHAKIELGDLDAAFKALGQLAERFPKSKVLGASRLRAAEAAVAGKQVDRAAELFHLAADAPEPLVASRAKVGLGWAMLDAGKPDEAAAAFAAFLASAPKEDPLVPEAALAQAKALEAVKKPEEALAAYALVAQTYAKTEQGELAALAQARLLAGSKRPADAAAVYAKFVADHPGYKPKPGGPGLDAVLADWGWALIDAEQPAEADKVFTRVLDEFPDSAHTADARFNLAESANQAKNYAEVIKLLTPLAAEGAKVTPRLLQSALYRLGRTQAETKDWPAAGKSLDRLLSDFPDSSLQREARLLRAEVALESDDPKTADAALTALASEPADPNDPPGFALAVRRRRVQSLLGLKKWDEVIKAAESFKADAPADVPTSDVEYARGRALQQLARMDDARAAYQAVIAARKGGGGDLAARAQFMIGETYYHQENYHEAIRQFLKVDILYDAPPWQASALLETGKAYERLAQWPDAAETYERLRTKEFPDDPNVAKAKAKAKERLDAVKPHLKGNDGSGDKSS